MLEELGGPTRVSRYLQEHSGQPLTPQAVNNWYKRGIPYFWRAALVLHANANGVAVPPNFLAEQRAPTAVDPLPFLPQ